jgi:phosphoribosylformylglycinamidine (FGAM) synthase PurS component
VLNMVIDIEIHDSQAEALSQVLKRIGFSEIRKLSTDDNEAYSAQYALEQIRQSLAEQGYNPR